MSDTFRETEFLTSRAITFFCAAGTPEARNSETIPSAVGFTKFKNQTSSFAIRAVHASSTQIDGMATTTPETQLGHY